MQTCLPTASACSVSCASAACCRAMGEGVEYLLADSQPPHLFILRKLYRHAHGALTTLAFYYILDGSVYQAPSLQAALLARMVGGCCGCCGCCGGCDCGCCFNCGSPVAGLWL